LIDLEHVREVGVDAARAAGELLRTRIDSIREVRHKSAVDLVTDVDVASEQLVCSRILAAFPTHRILGEEGGAIGGTDSRFRWLVDPLDGTTNYAHGFPLFCVSIGFELDGHLQLGVVYAPYLDELFVAEAGRGARLNERPIHVSEVSELPRAMLATGFPYDRAALPRALRSFEVLSFQSQAVRRVGSAAIDLCYVACGRFDAYWEHQVKPWDVAAGALLVQEAGGLMAATDGSGFSVDDGQALATNRQLQPAMIAALAGL
jgi:myo-inositol-1(or 4)-monophosphatase